ncbi:hypothetical protein GCM10022209_29010 [Chitinophaga oryziterrae]
MHDTIISLYNKDDFKGIYNFASESMKTEEPEAKFVNMLKTTKEQTGKIISSTSLGEYGITRSFMWTGEHGNIHFDLQSGTPGVMDDYFINDVIMQPGGEHRSLPTDNPLRSKIDSIIQQAATLYMQNPNTVALSVGIVYKGQKYAYNYGETQKNSGQLPSSDNYYCLGSIAKTFIATLLAKAVTEKKVNLNDDIRKYLPGKYPDLTYKGYPVRLVHLTNHTSGLPTSPDALPPGLSRLQQLKIFEKYNRDSLLDDLHHFRPDTLPGVKYVYNGNAFHILMLILEEVYHQPYEKLMTAFLRTELNMYHTKNFFSVNEKKMLLQGYNNHSEPQTYYYPMTAFRGGPAINSTLNDMLIYLKANIGEKSPAIKLTHQYTWGNKDGSSMGLGWMRNLDAAGKQYIMHSGNAGAGFNSLCLFYPERELGIVIMVNETTGQNRLFALERLITQQLK